MNDGFPLRSQHITREVTNFTPSIRYGKFSSTFPFVAFHSLALFCRALLWVYYKIVKCSNNYHAIYKSLRMRKRFQVSDYKVHKAKHREMCIHEAPDCWRFDGERYTRECLVSARKLVGGGRRRRKEFRLIRKWVKFIGKFLEKLLKLLAREVVGVGYVLFANGNGKLVGGWMMRKLPF